MGRDAARLPAMDERDFDVQSVAEVACCVVEFEPLETCPQFQLVAAAAAGEAVIAVRFQVGREVAWRAVAAERTETAETASISSDRTELDQVQDVP